MPLVKSMMIVSSHGYITVALGSFFMDEKNNDREIAKSSLFNDVQGFRNWLNPGDIIVVDRGFCSCLTHLQKMGYDTKMP